jgi:RNA polymerase sigma-70 factor (ECF subfamily)
MSTIAIPRASSKTLTPDLEDIFREHSRLVYRTAYSITGSWQDAEDILQTIFVRLLEREQPLEFTRSPGAYMYRAAVNASLNILQTHQRRNTTHDVESLEAVTPMPRVDDEIRRALLDAIAQLHPKSVEILILHYEHNYSDAQIAKMLAKSRGTVAVTLYRARARLKKLMLSTRSGGKR